MTDYRTYWKIRGQLCHDYNAMREAVERDELVEEISAESQQAEAEKLARMNEKQDLPSVLAEKFKPYWIIAGKRHTDYAVVKRLVLAGDIAIEIGPEQQAAEATAKLRAQKIQADVEGSRYRELTRQRYTHSPEGQRAEALRTAAENPGGIVSGGATAFSEACAEMEQYSPANTKF